MNTQFTPGPWHANGSQIVGKSGKRHQYVADALRDNGVETANANARLIAAAPELFEACQAVLTRQDWPVGTCKIKAQIVAALAKATGEQP